MRTYPGREAIRMLAAKLWNNPVVGDCVFHWGRDGFDHWVARNLDDVDVLYGYEYGSLNMFEAAKRMGISTVYDLPSPEHDFVEKILAPEYDRFPKLRTSYRAKVVKLHQERTERRRCEWVAADLIVANSSFTANSWIASGWGTKPTPFSPPSGQATGSFNGLHTESKFLAARESKH